MLRVLSREVDIEGIRRESVMSSILQMEKWRPKVTQLLGSDAFTCGLSAERPPFSEQGE